MLLLHFFDYLLLSMNFYVRYFDNETLVPTIEDVINYLEDFPEIGLSQSMKQEIREYAASDIGFPKRCKVRPRVYFIIIKTEAQSMKDFKEKKALRTGTAAELKAAETTNLNERREGWYEGTLDFKRVVTNHLGKCEYRDTTFTAQVKATSAMDCYNRITQYLLRRVDNRSQFPSCKGRNFQYVFLGRSKDNTNGEQKA